MGKKKGTMQRAGAGGDDKKGGKGGKKPKESAQEKKARLKQVEDLFNAGSEIHNQALELNHNPKQQFELLPQAIAKYEEACSVSTDLDALNNWGNALFLAAKAAKNLGKPASQIDSLMQASIAKHQEAITFDTSRRGATTAFVHNNLGNTYVYLADEVTNSTGDSVQVGEWLQQAVQCYDASLGIDGSDVDVLVNLIAALRSILALWSRGNVPYTSLDAVKAVHTRCTETVQRVLTGSSQVDASTTFECIADGMRADMLYVAIILASHDSTTTPLPATHVSEVASVVASGVRQARALTELAPPPPDPNQHTARALAAEMQGVAAEAARDSGSIGEAISLHKEARDNHVLAMSCIPTSTFTSTEQARVYAQAGDNEYEYFQTLLPHHVANCGMTLTGIDEERETALRSAIDAYTKAVQLNEQDLTSRYNLACSASLLVPSDAHMAALCQQQLQTLLSTYMSPGTGSQNDFSLSQSDLTSDVDFANVKSTDWFAEIVDKCPA